MSGEQEPLSMKRNMLWNSAGSFTNLLAQWLITVLVVRIASGYDAAGLYSLAVSVYGIFAPVAQYRMYTYQISDTHHENTVGEYFTLRVITNGIALVACFGYALLTCPLSAVPAIMLYGLFKSAALLIDVFHACDQRHYRMDYIGISLAMQGVSSLAIFALAFSLTQNLEITLALMSLALLVIGLVYDMPRSNGFEKLRLGITWRKTRYLLLKCLPIVIGALAMAAAVSAPRQYLFDAMGEATLGVYASVAAPVAIIQTGASYIYYPLIGYFADYYDRGEKRKLIGLLLRVTGGIALVGVACAVLLELFRGSYPRDVFRQQYRPIRLPSCSHDRIRDDHGLRLVSQRSAHCCARFQGKFDRQHRAPCRCACLHGSFRAMVGHEWRELYGHRLLFGGGSEYGGFVPSLPEKVRGRSQR